MRRFFGALALIAAGAVMSTGAVLAVGGGSGGSTPTCSADTWSCSGWTSCSTAGEQIRTCTLTFDCPTATTPRPDEEQPCTPPKTENVNAGGSTNSATNATRPTNANRNTNTTPSASTNRNTSTVCTDDAWSCGDWSATCDTEGRQSRSCSLTSDCPSASTKPPEQFRPCEKLQCGTLTTLRERVRCRLRLTPAGLTRELQIEYLPEECREFPVGASRQDCIRYYRNYQPCWSKPVGEARFACARDVLEIGPTVRSLAQACREKTGEDRTTCTRGIQDKVFDLIKFRFYDLEQRAENLGERGANLDAVADFVATVETKKQAFNTANTTAEHRQIILDVRVAWRDFLNRVRAQIR